MASGLDHLTVADPEASPALAWAQVQIPPAPCDRCHGFSCRRRSRTHPCDNHWQKDRSGFHGGILANVLEATTSGIGPTEIVPPDGCALPLGSHGRAHRAINGQPASPTSTGQVPGRRSLCLVTQCFSLVSCCLYLTCRTTPAFSRLSWPGKACFFGKHREEGGPGFAGGGLCA